MMYPKKVEKNKIEGLEVKNKQEPPKPIEVKLPEKTTALIEELKVKKGKLANQYFNLSFQADEVIDKKNETRRIMKETDNRIGKEVKRSFDKLKLKNRKEYRWSYNANKNVFVGILMPEKPKK